MNNLDRAAALHSLASTLFGINNFVHVGRKPAELLQLFVDSPEYALAVKMGLDMKVVYGYYVGN